MVRQGPGDFGGGTGDDGSDGGSSSGGSSGSDDSFDRRDQERDVVTSPPSGGGDSGDGADAGDIDDALDRGSDTASGGGGTVAPDDGTDSTTEDSSPTGGENQTTTRRMEEADQTRPDSSDESGDGGDTIAEGVESGVTATDLAGTSAVSQASQIQQQAAQVEQQYAQQRPGVSEEDVQVDIVERDGELAFQTSVSEQARRQAAANRYRRELTGEPTAGTVPGPTDTGGYGVRGDPVADEITESDIQLSDDGAQLDEETQREVAAEQFQRSGVDVGADEVEVTDSGAQLTEDAQERIAAERVEVESGRSALNAIFGTATGAAGVPGSLDVASEVDADVARSFGMQRGRDFTVETGDGDVSVETTEDFRERTVAQQLGVPASIIEEGEDYRVAESDPADTRDGVDLERGFEGTTGVQLTPEGRRTAIEAQAIEQGEVAVGAPEASVGGITIGGGQRTVDVESPEQLEFGDDGQLENVRQAETTDADIQAGEDRLADALTIDSQLGQLADEYDVDLGQGSQSAVGQATARFAFASREGLQTFGDVSTDVGATIYEGVDIPGTDVQVGIEPAAEVTGDVAEYAARDLGGGLPFLQPGGGVGVIDTDTAASQEDIFRGEEEEIEAPSFVESTTQEFAAGAGSIARAGVELPDTVATGAEVTGQAGAFAAQNPVEDSLYAAGSTGVRVGEQVATQAINQPVGTAGALVGSGAIFRASRSVGPRTSAAARYSIQPGEELLGAGGYRATRAVAGERTADRAFPDQEPLFMSEEAAIRGGQRVAGGIRSGAQRASERIGAAGDRLRFGEFVQSERAQLGSGLRFRDQGERSRDAGDMISDERAVADVGEGSRLEGGPGMERRSQSRRRRTRGGSAARERARRLSPPRSEVREEIGAEQPEGFEAREFDPMLGRFVESESTAREAQQRMEEAQQPFAAETGFEAQSEMLELAFEDAQPDAAADVAQELEQRTALAERSEVLSETGLRMDTEAETDTRQELRPEIETRTQLDVESETETEQRTDLEQELRRETESELESEFEFGREVESRRERMGDESTDTGGGRQFPGLEGGSDEIITDFADPLTGQRRQTSREADLSEVWVR